MKDIGHVNSEGGPLFLADARTARSWHGVEGDGSDYERACAFFDQRDYSIEGGLISVGQEEALLWELFGAGTGHVFLKESDHMMIVRVWINNPSGYDAVVKLAELHIQQALPLGSLQIPSGVLAILWATQSGECIVTPGEEGKQLSVSNRALESTVLLVSLPPGVYACLHDEVRLEDGQHARRCHLIKQE